MLSRAWGSVIATLSNIPQRLWAKQLFPFRQLLSPKQAYLGRLRGLGKAFLAAQVVTLELGSRLPPGLQSLRAATPSFVHLQRAGQKRSTVLGSILAELLLESAWEESKHSSVLLLRRRGLWLWTW